MVSLGLLKILVSLILFLLTFLSGMVPLKFSSFTTSPKFQSVSNCFAGGLFMGLSILHLLPEAQMQFNRAQLQQQNLKLSELQNNITTLGQLNTNEINQLLQQLAANHSGAFPWINFTVLVMFFTIVALQNLVLDGHSHGNVSDQSPISPQLGVELNYNDTLQYEQIKVPQKVIDITSDKDQQTSKNQSQQNNRQQEQCQKSSTAFLLLIALSIHSFFEGLALGIMKERTTCVTFMIAVLMHKWAESFALGLEMKKQNLPSNIQYTYLAILSSLNIIGVVAGMELIQFGDRIIGIFQALSVGTFLYISTIDILSGEFSSNTFKFSKFFSALSSVFFVCILQYFFRE